MSVMKVGSDVVDMNDACAMVEALRKVRIRLIAGQLRETTRIDGEEITFMRANDTRLTKLIAEYEAQCARTKGGTRRSRFAKGIRWT